MILCWFCILFVFVVEVVLFFASLRLRGCGQSLYKYYAQHLLGREGERGRERERENTIQSC